MHTHRSGSQRSCVRAKSRLLCPLSGKDSWRLPCRCTRFLFDGQKAEMALETSTWILQLSVQTYVVAGFVSAPNPFVSSGPCES